MQTAPQDLVATPPGPRRASRDYERPWEPRSAPVGAGNDLGFRWGDPAVTPFHPDLKLVDQSGGAAWSGVVEAAEMAWDGGLPEVLSLQRTTSTTTTHISGSLCSTAWDPNVEAVSGVLAPNQIHFCNFNFGDTGWAGLAINWVTADGEIVVAQTLMNDFFL